MLQYSGRPSTRLPADRLRFLIKTFRKKKDMFWFDTLRTSGRKSTTVLSQGMSNLIHVESYLFFLFLTFYYTFTWDFYRHMAWNRCWKPTDAFTGLLEDDSASI